ncbi:FtsX-like permease family protein [Aquabacterium sp.]|uniref:FtsX-like permease family protein n=1 Tax=Aquabacterium sp. TaxID=1872578 RepID=UPI002CBD71BE|nr:FtsX-like permease family protein [Aquabacterium sp.]HSW03065.1 FtsX-like permease family protein [Aquabacterium sp.]
MSALLHDALRGLRRRRGPTAVAVSGLMLAQAAGLLVALLAIALAAPDPAISDPHRVVVLDFKRNPPGPAGPTQAADADAGWPTASPVAFAPMLKQRQLPLDLISRAVHDGIDINHRGGLQPVYLLLADPDLVALLGLRALHGDLRATLARRDGIAISPTVVQRLWGELPLDQALGRRIEARGSLYTVGAVIPNSDPRSPVGANTIMGPIGQAMAMAGYDSQANTRPEHERNAIHQVNGRVLARLRPGTSPDQVGGWMREAFIQHPLYAQLPAEWGAGREAAFFRAVTLDRLPFEGADRQLRWRLIGAVAAAAALLLLLAAFNAMNLQAADLLQRQRETALRRALGANSAQLLQLWALEALLPLLLSAAGALLLAWWVAPAVAQWMGLPPSQPLADPIPLQALLGLSASVVLLLPLTLAVPAWLALRNAPAPALQGRTASEGPWGRRVRQGLLALQLGGALLLLSLAGVLALQQQHLLHADRGFDTRNRLWLGVLVNPDFVPNMDAFVAALGQHPAIRHWAFSNARPARDTEGPTELHVSTLQGQQHKQLLRLTTVSPSFFDTYGMTLLAGRPQTAFSEARLVIDAKAARQLGFASPQAAIGALLRGGGDALQEGSTLRRVVAVVKDVKLESARDAALPQAFLLSDQPQWDLSVEGPDPVALRQALDTLWKAHGPALMVHLQTADEQRAEAYQQEAQLTWTLAAVSLLAVGVAMLGAYALVADTLRRRRTELVLRRLHGAGHGAIVRRVAAEFTLPLLIAAAAGLPVAAWLGGLYLAGFEDRVDSATGLALPLAVASAAMLLTTALAALRHVRQALALQPIEALQ